jgi:gas vesicle protein
VRTLSRYFALILTVILLSAFVTIVFASGSNEEFGQINMRDWKNALSGMVWSRLKNVSSIPKSVLGNELSSGSFSALLSSGSNFTLNKRVSIDMSGFYENEPSIAASPNNPDVLVVGTHQYTSTTVFTAVYRSTDGGGSWIGPILLPLSKPSDYFASDPSVIAVGNAFYYSYMSIGFRTIRTIYGNTTIFSNDIVVARSFDNGASWQISIAVSVGNMNFSSYVYIFDVLFDKPYIGGGFVNGKSVIVVSYTEFVDGYDFIAKQYFTNVTIKAVFSYDGGITWSNPVSVSPTYTITSSSSIVRIVQGSMPVVGPDGTIYIAFYDSGEDGWLVGRAYVMVSRSVDGGRTFSTPVVAAIIPHEMSYYSGAIGFRWWSSMFPSIAVGPNGAVYVVYCGSPDGVDPGDVFFVRSIDGGITWSQPLRVNDDNTKNGQFFPWIAVGPDGVIHIIWGDRRLDPEDFGYDVYYASSSDGGASFSRNMRVTDYTNNPLFGMSFFIGDYFNVVATNKNVHVVWTDSRRGFKKIGGFYWIGVDESIYTAKLGLRPTPILNVSPSNLQSGQSFILNVAGSNLPAEAPLVIYVDGVPLGTFPAVFSDKNGKLTLNVTIPVSSVGSHKVTINDFTTGITIAGSSLMIKDYTSQNLLNRLDNSTNSILNSISNINARLNDLYNSVNVLRSQIVNSTNNILNSINSMQNAIKSQIADSANNILNSINNTQKAIMNNINIVKNSLDSARNAIISSINNSQSAILDNVRNSINTMGTYLGIPLVIVLALEIVGLILVRRKS